MTRRPSPRNAIDNEPGEPASGDVPIEPRRRVRAPQSRRAELMEAAERLFLAKGVIATNVDDITRAAQVAKGTFYLYFASRDAMLSAMQERFIHDFCERVRLAMSRHRAGSWDARLRTWFETALDVLLGQVMLHDMLFHDVRPGDRDVMVDNPVIQQLADLLREGSDAGAWRIGDARSLAVMMFHAMHGLADEAVARGSADKRSRMVRLLSDTFSGALRRE